MISFKLSHVITYQLRSYQLRSHVISYYLTKVKDEENATCYKNMSIIVHNSKERKQ